MPITENTLALDCLSQKGGKLDDRITQYKIARKHCFEEFNQPVAAFADAGGGAATGTAGDVNILVTPENTFEYAIKGIQTIIAPVVTTVGLDLGMDQTDNDGVELTNGIIAASRQRNVFVVGTDEPFFVRAKIKVEDISGTDDLCVGFRKAEAYQANVDDYDEAAFLQVGGGAAGRYNSETILNNAATTTTNLGLTAWADGETHELEVRVTGRAVTFYVDGDRAAAAPSFNFDSGEIVIPFLFFLHATDVAGKVELIEWEWGYQKVKDVLD